MSRSVAIMQPTFLPWTGYFGLIAEVEDFVFLDDVQFSKQSWQSRNRIVGPNGIVIVVLPVSRKPSKSLICDARLAENASEATLHKRVAGCLATAPYWTIAETLLRVTLTQIPNGLAAVNITFIQALSELLGFSPRFYRSSEMDISSADKSNRLMSICSELGATRYLSPVGSAEYLKDSNPFSETGISLRFQTFEPIKYNQHNNTFTSHMSALDALAWMGPDALSKAIRDNTHPARTLDAVLSDTHEPTNEVTQ